MPSDALTRRALLARLSALGLALCAGARSLRAAGPAPSREGKHPTPRPGIDASKVLKRGQLEEHPESAPVFDLVREIPQVVDGIRCQCGCAEIEGFYSLLSCFEADGMAAHCAVCQGEAKLVHRMHKQGKTLAQIRAAIDKEYGG